MMSTYLFHCDVAVLCQFLWSSLWMLKRLLLLVILRGKCELLAGSDFVLCGNGCTCGLSLCVNFCSVVIFVFSSGIADFFRYRRALAYVVSSCFVPSSLFWLFSYVSIPFSFLCCFSASFTLFPSDLCSSSFVTLFSSFSLVFLLWCSVQVSFVRWARCPCSCVWGVCG